MKVFVFLFAVVFVAVECRCPTDWTEDSGSCWFISKTQLKWTDASAFCEAFHGELATIPDLQVKNFIQSFIGRAHGDKFWIDGTDMLREGHWLWANSNTEIDLASLGINHIVDNANDKNCLYIEKSEHYRWAAEACDDEAYFICEHVPVGGGSSILG